MAAHSMLDPSAHWRQRDVWQRATLGLLAATAVLWAITLPSYGATWDEENVVKQGSDFILWYLSGFQDRRVTQPRLDRLYGGFFSGVAVTGLSVIGRLSYEALHALTALFGLVGLAVAAWIGTRLGGSLGGFLSALFLCLTPSYYGHVFNNPKDLPFAVLLLGSFAAIVRAWPTLPRPRLGHVLLIGVTIGLSLAVRVVALIAFLYLACALVGWIVWKAWPTLRVSTVGPLIRPLMVPGLIIVVTAWTVMLVWWPYAQLNPVLNPFRALAELGSFSWNHPVRFNGSDVMSTQLPWTYIPIWFAHTLPDFYAVSGALGVVALMRWWKQREPHDVPRVMLTALLWITVVLPVVLVVVRRSVLYDGTRHVLFIVPPLAIGIALGAAAFFRRVRSRPARLVAGAALLGSLGVTIVDMVRLHPYQSVYFNRLVAGGLAGAAGRFETDYWGQSYKEGVEWVVANVSSDGARPLRVANCNTPFLTGYYLERAPTLKTVFESVGIGDQPDLVLATTRWNCHRRHPGHVLHTVERDGVPLCYVIDVRGARVAPGRSGRR